jgi:hypothetical protein
MFRFAPVAAALLLPGAGWAQTVDFELRTVPGSPVVFAGAAGEPAPGMPRRQLVAIRNESNKPVMAVIFEQSVAGGARTSIVALDRVEIVFAPGGKRRVSVDVADVSHKLQSGELPGRPVLTLVAVEFLDGSQWNAPTGPGPPRRLE